MMDSWRRFAAVQQWQVDEELGPIMVVSSRVLARPDVEVFEDLDDLEPGHARVEGGVDDDQCERLNEDALAVDLLGKAAAPFAAGPGPRVGARKRGKFVAELDDHQLLDALAAVAKGSGAKEPGSLSKRDWDYARVDQGRNTLSTAESIRQRFNRPWAELLRIALSPLDDRGRHLGWHARGEQYTDAYEMPVAKALRAVAHRLQRIPTQIAYDVEVKKLEAASRRGRYMIHLHLPISATIIDREGSWDQAIARAKLTQPVEKRHVPPPLVDSLDVIVSESGLLPSRKYLLKWVRVRDIPVSGEDVSAPYAHHVTALRELRAARGMSTPSAITPENLCPPLPAPPRTFQNRRNSTYTNAELIASVRRFLTEFPQVKRTAKSYAAHAKSAHLIGLTAMRQQGWRWQQILAAARKP